MTRTYSRRPIADRFWEKVDRRGPHECWPWLSVIKANGYGTISKGAHGAGEHLAHRLAYELSVGPIPDGMQIDHRCRNRRCANPAHLEVVTPRENQLRSPITPGGKTHCKHGHDLSGANLRIVYRSDGTRKRECRECRRATYRRWWNTSRSKP